MIFIFFAISLSLIYCRVPIGENILISNLLIETGKMYNHLAYNRPRDIMGPN